MANFKSVQLFEALNNGETKSQGLTIEKAKDGNNVFVDTLPYGEFSLANIAQISNTIKALAQHIYNNFIPNDRIIPGGSVYKESTNSNVDLIFYKFNNSTEVTNAGTNFNFRKYLITGENLRENIKYHKPNINGTQNYNSTNNFIVPTATSDPNYTGRDGTLYGGKGNTAEFLGVQISQNYKEIDSNKSSAELKADHIILNMSTPFKVDNTPATTDTTLTYIDSTLNKNTLVISSGGIAKSQKDENTFINTVENATSGGSFTFFSGAKDDGTLQTKTVTFSPRGLITKITEATDTNIKVMNINTETEKDSFTFYSDAKDDGTIQTKTVTFSTNGLIKKISGATDTNVKIIDKNAEAEKGKFTFYSDVTNDGTLQEKEVTFSTSGLITNVTAAEGTDNKVINKGSQTFEGLKTFSDGVGLPSDGATGSYIYLS